jgi:hypothetical protein
MNMADGPLYHEGVRRLQDARETRRRGIVQMYISRTGRFVWVERASDRPSLITPEQPEAFVRALSELRSRRRQRFSWVGDRSPIRVLRLAHPDAREH